MSRSARRLVVCAVAVALVPLGLPSGLAAAASAGPARAAAAPRSGIRVLKEQPLAPAARRSLKQRSQASGALQEITSLRTRTSDTYLTASGAYQTVLSAGSVNYQDPTGAWQPIDDSLVSSTVPGYAYQNKANAYTLQLPSDLSGAPVKVTAGGQWVSYSLAGARGPARSSGPTDTFATALPGVAVSYTAAPDLVKEAIVLASPAAPASFSFHVQMSPGLTANTGGGGLSFADSSGHAVLQIPAPAVSDASGAGVAPASAVSLTTASAAGGMTVTVTVDPAWLASTSRAWPVTIDPTTVVNPSQDCAISQETPTTSYCTSPTMTIGSEPALQYARRALVQFDLSSIPRPRRWWTPTWRCTCPARRPPTARR